MNKPWLNQYPPGVPAEIDVDRHRSIVALLDHSVSRFAERPAYSNFGTTLSYHQLDQLSTHLAAFFQQELGLMRGDRVAVMMPNVLQNPVSIFAILRAGLTVVNVNPLYTPRELRHQLKDSGAKAILVLENFAHTLEQVVAETALEHVIITRIGDLLDFPKSMLLNLAVKYLKRAVAPWSIPNAISLTEALDQGEKLTLQHPDLTPLDIAFLQYTGGTTGVSKGAVLTHRNLIANLIQLHAWTDTLLKDGEEIIVTALPLYHIFSLTANCLLMMEKGGCNLLITNPRDFKGFVKILQRERFTCFTGLNSLFNALMHTDGFNDIDFSQLKLTVGGGMATQSSVAAQWQQLTGSAITEAYGLTETSPCVTCNPVNQTQFSGSIGLPVPSTDCSIQDDQGNLLPADTAGELCIRGPQVMQEYWQRPDETAKAIIDGWFHSGDIATMDEHGYFYIVDRKKDMILVSGFNVYPNEIEAVVASLPGVLECAVIGIPDECSGEAVKLFVVKSDPALSRQQVEDHCHQQLTAYKRPKVIEFCEELPKSNVGKILRRELRDTSQ